MIYYTVTNTSILHRHANINVYTGLVTFTSAVDYEDITSFWIEVTATDMGYPPLSSSRYLTVEIKV